MLQTKKTGYIAQRQGSAVCTPRLAKHAVRPAASFSIDKQTHQVALRPRPEELQELSFDYKYDISALFNAFDFINVSKFAQRIGVSPSLMRHYKGGDTYISDNQAKRIESGLHQLARELLSVTL